MFKNYKVIRKKQKPRECHHLQIILKTGRNKLYFPIDTLAGKRFWEFPGKNYLELGLSMERGKAAYYYCAQCGERFGEWEYKLYARLFRKAKICHYDVWKLKELFAQRNVKWEKELLKEIIPGRQRYSRQISWTAAMDAHMEEDDTLYEKAIKNFR